MTTPETKFKGKNFKIMSSGWLWYNGNIIIKLDLGFEKKQTTRSEDIVK